MKYRNTRFLTQGQILQLFVFAISLLLPSFAYCQRAEITGTILDQNGAAVTGVRVVLLNVDQGLKREATTGSEGYFAAPFLQPGHYVVTAQKSGFAVAEINNLDLHVGDIRSIQIQLQVGGERVLVHVNGQSQQVETVSPALGEVVTGNVIRNAPLDGRNVLQLALLQPGVTPTDPDDSGGRFNVTGNRSDSVTYLLDGGINNDLINNLVVFNPNPDTIAEFRILTSNYPAEFGRNAGGIVSVLTRSGSNNLHGSLFEFLRNDELNANSFFNNRNGLPREVLKRNQFGGTVGGPIVLPHWINGKDRFFFFLGYQGQRQVRNLSVNDTDTFTPAELAGDFSKSARDSKDNPVPDPGVAAFLQAHPFFAQNASQAIIDPARIDGVARNYIATGLMPTSPTGLVSSQGHSVDNRDELTGKVDFELTPKDKLSATVGFRRDHQLRPFEGANVPGFPDALNSQSWFFDSSYTHILTPNLLNEFRVALQRQSDDTEKPAVSLPTAAMLGIGITPDLSTGPPNLVFDTGLSLGFSVLGPQRIADTTWSFSDTLTWNPGRHNWKMGGGISPFENNSYYAFTVDGEFFFAGQGGVGTGNAFADFLLGIPSNFFQSAAARSSVRSTFRYGFAQDEWHVRQNLVLTLGVRYEYSTPKSDTQGRTFSVIPGRQSSIFPGAPPGMLFPGDAGAPRGVNFPDKKDWAPRIGFAWDPWNDGRTSLRGGFGMFYDVLKGEDNLQFNGQPPFYSSVGLNFSPVPSSTRSEINYMSQPFLATGSPNPFPSRQPPSNINFANAGFLPVGSSGSVFIVNPHLRTPYIYQYNLSVQHQLARNTVAEVDYVGSSSHGLTALMDVNPFQLGTNNRILNVGPEAAACGPFLCYAALPEFRNATNGSYNAFQASVTKQFSSAAAFGRSYFTFGYNYSHNIDNASGFQNRNFAVPYYHPNLFRSSSDMDLRHRVVLSGGWELPFDRLWEEGPVRATRGWNLFPILSWQTGFPIDIFAFPGFFDFTDPGPSGAGDPALVRANLTRPVQMLDPHQGNNYWFNPASFDNSSFSPGSYGTLPRNLLRGPGRFNLDMAFSKATPLFGDRMKLELRADFFNLFNSVEFMNPNTNIANVRTFGRITSTYSPRIVQLAARFSF
jgi:Carboxypeptidase regulatory-like domain/TonB-dependent Receptor Plug Domain